MKTKDLPILLSVVVLLVQTTQGFDPCLKTNDTCDYPRDLCTPQQRSTRSTDAITYETFDQALIALNHMDNYIQAFGCADSEFKTTWKDIRNQTMTAYINSIKHVSLKELINRLNESRVYIIEMRMNTTNSYDKQTLEQMKLRMDATFNTIHNTSVVDKKNKRANRIKEQFHYDQSVTTQNRQRKMIFTIFRELYKRLNTTFQDFKKEIHDSKDFLDSFYKQKKWIGKWIKSQPKWKCEPTGETIHMYAKFYRNLGDELRRVRRKFKASGKNSKLITSFHERVKNVLRKIEGRKVNKKIIENNIDNTDKHKIRHKHKLCQNMNISFSGKKYSEKQTITYFYIKFKGLIDSFERFLHVKNESTTLKKQ